MSTPDNEHNLMLQAVATAETYFEKAVRIIDAQFGEGYAKANPAVLAAFMGACSADFSATMLSNSLTNLGAAISDSLSSIADSLE